MRVSRILLVSPIAPNGLMMTITIEYIWLAIGFLGQGLFFGRWVVQWIASEKKAESQVPISFWYMSLIGGLITLAYAIYREDPVFIAGQSIGSLVYIRNLMLIARANQTNQPASPSPPRT
ncbi:MAG TPA: lipid-A-disaccharide synthase N-terminal domain-containing protein [Nitrospiraceae bacterium]|nr:lipid-A-disaccharide synthase N-terminal domain-containing protein [Nitrospiraceae bacterium]